MFPDDGVSIPCEYTSYLAPLQSSKLYNEVRATKDKDKSIEVLIGYKITRHSQYLAQFINQILYKKTFNTQDITRL